MVAKDGRNVSLTTHQSEFVDALVASGRYGSASEVIRDGLRLLQDAERRRWFESWLADIQSSGESRSTARALRRQTKSTVDAAIQEGLDALDRGQSVDGDAFFDLLEQSLKNPRSRSHRAASKRRRT